MSSSLSINAQSVQNVHEASMQNLSLDLQNSIKQGDADLTANLIAQGLSLNQSLPNGELPLHFAVRLDKQEIVSTLLKLGADPEIKDFQELSAIDHAVLMKNESMLANILGCKIGKDVKEIEEQIKCKGSSSHINQLNSKIQKISTVDVPNLIFSNKAAYQGDIYVLNTLSSQTINEFDANGLAPIHYAILNGQSAAVEKLIELGSNINMLTREGDSLLHFAAINGSLKIIETLINSGIDFNHKNSAGETALHYASAKENLTVVEALVKHGSNPHFLDNQGMSPLALIGASAFQRDPLALPRAQVVMFATASLYWLSSMALAGGWVTSNQAQLATAFVVLGTSIIANWSEFAILVTNLDKTWKKVLAWIGMFGIAAIPPFNIGFQAWKTYHVARSAFEGLKKCWNNIGYRNWDVTKNVIVYSANTAHSTHQLYATCEATYTLYLSAPYFQRMMSATFKIAEAQENGDFKGLEEAQSELIEAYVEYLRFLQDRYNIDDKPVDVSNCANIAPSSLEGLSTIERLRKPELNPNCPEHALMMISPEFTMDALREKGVSLYKKTFLQIMLKDAHPDKAGASEEIKEAAVRLNAASNTLKKWVEKNT